MSLFKKIITLGLSKEKVSQETVKEIEKGLLNSDLSKVIVNEIIEKVRKSKDKKIEEIKKEIAQYITNIIKPREAKLNTDVKKVIVFCGVNGSGKTTTIGKLASQLKQEGKKPLIAACDTFRAAAVEQLDEWASRSDCDIEKPLKAGEDPSAVAFRAGKKFQDEDYDILMIDTAGRLQTNLNLMEQLSKLDRILRKNIPEEIEIEKILILDGTIGQNVIPQFEQFTKAANIDGIIITKLDSSSHGGALVSIAKEKEVKIYKVGLGEKIEDIRDFNAEEFANGVV